jgi:hypothetical protein
MGAGWDELREELLKQVSDHAAWLDQQDQLGLSNEGGDGGGGASTDLPGAEAAGCAVAAAVAASKLKTETARGPWLGIVRRMAERHATSSENWSALQLPVFLDRADRAKVQSVAASLGLWPDIQLGGECPRMRLIKVPANLRTNDINGGFPHNQFDGLLPCTRVLLAGP